MIPSYPKVYALGHAAIPEVLADPVVVQEKIDGSQFSFALLGDELHMRSKGAVVHAETAGMFSLAVATVHALHADGALPPGRIYRSEYLAKPRHNTLKYERVPVRHLILFDVQSADAPEQYMPPGQVEDEAHRIGLECVPQLGTRTVSALDEIHALLAEPSCLGGMREGIVLKNYARFCRDGHVQMGKFVSEKFKETHKVAWRASNPTRGDILDALGAALAAEPRWQKAVQHLREAGTLESDPRDIGKLIAAVRDDVLTEERDRILEALWKWASPQLARAATRGLPEWYKEQLAATAFGGGDA